MPKKDRQAGRLKHMSGGGNLYRETKVKVKKAASKGGRP
ncbi:hypothetical protein [Devosia sp. DBB001]|jgi:hypothetical protein|nr:hypothetical protein [Devosia sp. DBB001]